MIRPLAVLPEARTPTIDRPIEVLSDRSSSMTTLPDDPLRKTPKLSASIVSPTITLPFGWPGNASTIPTTWSPTTFPAIVFRDEGTTALPMGVAGRGVDRHAGRLDWRPIGPQEQPTVGEGADRVALDHVSRGLPADCPKIRTPKLGLFGVAVVFPEMMFPAPATVPPTVLSDAELMKTPIGWRALVGRSRPDGFRPRCRPRSGRPKARRREPGNLDADARVARDHIPGDGGGPADRSPQWSR